MLDGRCSILDSIYCIVNFVEFSRGKIRYSGFGVLPAKQRVRRGIGFHFLKYQHKNHSKNNHINPEILRDGPAFVNRPRVKLERIIIPEEFQKEPGDSIKNKNQ